MFFVEVMFKSQPPSPLSGRMHPVMTKCQVMDKVCFKLKEYKCLNGKIYHNCQLHGGTRRKVKGPIKGFIRVHPVGTMNIWKEKVLKAIIIPRIMVVKLVKTYYTARLYLVKVRKCGRFITVLVSSRDYDFDFWIWNAHVQFLLWSQWYLLLTCSEVADSTRLAGPVL